MIGVVDYAAVFSRPAAGLERLPKARVDPDPPEEKTMSACAAYALAAATALGPIREDAALICVSGPTGATVTAFEKAWRASKDGRLTGPGFGKSRYKRIHPFTLVRCMQNQVPAMLSMRLGLKGPCLNAVESATALAWLLPNAAAALERSPELLLVMASAGFREEERAKQLNFIDERDGLEGAVCLRATRDGALGRLSTIEPLSPPPARLPVEPALEAGIRILGCIAENARDRVIPLKDRSGRTAFLHWRGE